MTTIPDEIFQLVESFKKFVREQKAYKDQKFEVDLILEVGKETEDFYLAFQKVAVESDKNSRLIQQIKDDTTKLLRHSESAYSLLLSNSRPNRSPNASSTEYFQELAEQFESRMKAYGEHIKELKMSLDNIKKAHNVDELFKWLKQQHETLGEIAAKIYMTHDRIMEKKSEMDKINNPLRSVFT